MIELPRLQATSPGFLGGAAMREYNDSSFQNYYGAEADDIGNMNSINMALIKDSHLKRVQNSSMSSSYRDLAVAHSYQHNGSCVIYSQSSRSPANNANNS